MKDYCDENTFTQAEMKLVAGRWQFWRGLAIGAIGMLIGLFLVGIYLNY